MSLSLMMSIKRIIFTAIWVLVWGISGLPAFGQSRDVSETQLIQRAEQAITRIKTLQADFLQISSDGSVGEGILYFRRPTQLRLEYKNPETLTLITSRVWLYVDDKIAKSVQAIPIGQTPLSPLLQEIVSFRSAEFSTSARAIDGVAVISMTKEDGEAAGQLDLEFDTASWQLRRWVITDLLGVKTTVTLQNPVYGRALENRLFGVPGYDLAGDN